MYRFLKLCLKLEVVKLSRFSLQFLDFAQDSCPWFHEGTVNLETWQKVGEKLKSCYTPEGADGMPVFNFGMWSQIGEHLDSVL
jgi:hypothetical protein